MADRESDQRSPVAELRRVDKVYGSGAGLVRALDQLDLTVRRGDYLAVMGASGSGKSTAMNILGCLDRPSSGSYHLNGEAVEDLDDDALADLRNQQLGFVFQQFHLLPHATALENVMLPMIYAGLSPQQRREKASEALERVGLAERMKNRPNQLSGGQQQRVAIARALAMDPELMLFDEPTSSLDPERVKEVLDAMRRLAADGMTMIVVTHELGFAREVADRVLFMDAGRVVELTDSSTFFTQAREERSRRFLNQMAH